MTSSVRADALASFEYSLSSTGVTTFRAVFEYASNELIDAIQFALANRVSVEINSHTVYPQHMDISRDYDDYYSSLTGGSYPKSTGRRTLRVEGVESLPF